jgi:hypothetical protein
MLSYFTRTRHVLIGRYMEKLNFFVYKTQNIMYCEKRPFTLGLKRVKCKSTHTWCVVKNKNNNNKVNLIEDEP